MDFRLSADTCVDGEWNGGEVSRFPKLIAPPQNIIVGGLQGAGKGMVSSRLKKREHIVPYVSSDQMRAHPSYPQIASLLKAGVLVPDEKVFAIVRDFLHTRTRIAAAMNGQAQQALRTVFDGMPRTTGQKQAFDQLLKETGREPAWAVKLQLDEDPKVADEIARASVRYRVRRDAANGEARSDDTNPKTVERRIKAFHQQTEPLFDQYGEEGRLLVIDAKPTFDYDTLDIDDDETFDRSAEEIYRRFVETLNRREW